LKSKYILMMSSYILKGIFCLIFFNFAQGMYFNLPINSEKCLREEIHGGVLVKGEYEISAAPVQDAKVHIKVTDSNGHVLYQKEDATTGKFAFTTDEYDMFQICFTSKSPSNIKAIQTVKLNMKRGSEAKHMDDTDDSKQLKPLETELGRLEELSTSIANAFFYMKTREEEMRSTNESTNSRVLYFSAFSMLCLVGLATWQVLYLRKFFKSKKLIE